ncbi:MAG: hypothetical protein ACI4PF_04340 [Christensenellales bacterium]
MKENFLHFISETPSILSINGKHLGQIDNISNMELDVITKTPNIFVSYTPISNSKNALPYTFSLKTSDTPESDNQYIKVVPFPNNNYDIIMKPFYYYQVSQSRVLFNKNVGKYFVSIVSDNVSRITIFSGGTIVFNINVVELKEVKVEENKGLMIIEGVVDENNYYLLILDCSNFQVLHNDIVESIDASDEYISSYKKENTLCNHAKVFNIEVQTKNIDSYYVYSQETNNQINNLLIPYALLECIKVKDENKAKTFLGNSLSNTSISQLSSYFGDIKNIYFNRHNFNSKLNYTIETNTMKNYNFIMDNNKIIEIEENF